MRNGRGGPRLLVFPAWNNKYLTMLNRAPREAGYEILGVRRLHLDADGKQARRGDVLHIHWTQRIAQLAKSEQEAWSSVAEFTTFVRRLKRRGVHVVWTVHNVLPHELRYLEPELSLSRFLAENADRIHIMTTETPQVVEHLYRLPPDRLHHIPHFSYRGEYEPMPRGQARMKLGLGQEERSVLFFGRLRAYKGVDTLLSAIAILNERGVAPTLLLAGRPTPADEQERIEALLPTSSPVVARFSFVDDEDIPMWFCAADIAVFPFEQILNSGSVHLAATFGVPVILPDLPHLRSQFRHEPWVRYYEPEDAATSLADLLAQRDEMDHSASMARFAERLAPRDVSQQYLDMLRELRAMPFRDRRGAGLLRRLTSPLRGSPRR